MSEARAEEDTGGNTQLAGTLISLLALCTILARWPALASIDRLAVLALTVIFPSILGVVLLGVGYATARRDLVKPTDAWRFTAWIVIGMGVFLLVGGWILVLDVLLGRSVPFGYLLTLNAVTLGGIAGAVIGLYDARSREHTRTLERREDELRAQNERLDEFVSIVSHDLRNPLSVASTRLELAQEEVSSEHLAHVARSHERMEALIEDMLQIARQNQSVTAIEAVHLEEIVQQCWRNVDTGDAALAVDDDAVIEADESRLQQVFENLFRNAIEHGGENVTVTVGSVADGFYVEDDGPGIPPDARDDVFEAGYTSNPDGTGFGLSIVNQVVEAHEWEITVTDGSTGGARFEITGI